MTTDAITQKPRRVSGTVEELVVLPPVLDACCGSRKFWFDRDNPNALFIDSRRQSTSVNDKSKPGGVRWIEIAPDQLADFRNMPFPDESFSLVVFDPPHLRSNRTGKTSWMATAYGTLGPDWREDLAAGFRECFRVLRPLGVLVFKWAETNIRIGEVLALTDVRPLFGTRLPKQAGTYWMTFMKHNNVLTVSGERQKGQTT